MSRLLVAVAVVGLVFGVAFAAKDAAPKALNGSVVKVDGATVVVKVADKEEKVATDAKTKVTIDGKDAKVADLKAGMVVTVTPAIGTAEKIEAKSAAPTKGIFQAAKGEKGHKGLHGSVVKVDGDKVTIKSKDGEKVVATDANTKVTIDGKDAKVADLKAGLHVEVTPAEGTAATIVAKAAAAKKGIFAAAEKTEKAAALKGEVAKVDGDKVTVKANGKETVVATDAKTKVTIDGKDAKVADLKAGMAVEVTPATGTAATIAAKPAAAKKGIFAAAEKAEKVACLKGEVAKVDGDKVTVKANGKETVVATDAKTKVTIDGKDAKVADLKAGMAVEVTPATGTAATIAAKPAAEKKGIFAAAKEKGDAKAPAALKGAVVKVEADKVTVKVKDAEKVVATDANTKVTIDDKDAKVADLKAGMMVAITPAEGTAAKIEAKAPKAKEAK